MISLKVKSNSLSLPIWLNVLAFDQLDSTAFWHVKIDILVLQSHAIYLSAPQLLFDFYKTSHSCVDYDNHTVSLATAASV